MHPACTLAIATCPDAHASSCCCHALQRGAAGCVAPCYSVEDAFGPPDVGQCGLNASAWAPGNDGNQEEFIVLEYATPVYATQ